MSENSFSLIKCPQFLDNAISPPAKEIGNTLANIFYAVFSPINFNVEKLRMKHVENLKKYEADIQYELNQVPEEKLVEPQLSIVGPALEASKFYIEEEKMRSMFAKLIASSVNIDVQSKAHHSFVEIIKQLSPLDASNLSIVSLNRRLPIAKYQYETEEQNTAPLCNNVFLSNPNHSDIDAQATSITNLARLGLVDLAYGEWLTREGAYDAFMKTALYFGFEEKLKKSLSLNPNYAYKKLTLGKGVVSITPLGKDFVSVCM